MYYSFIVRQVLRTLSENSRASITELANSAKCSRNTAAKTLNKLEKEYNIRYLLEFNEEALGLYQRHIVKVKMARKPSEEELANMFSNDDIVQFAAVTEGDYDLLIYATTPTGLDYIKWETRTSVMLSKYKPIIRPSQVAMFHIGFIPLMTKMLDKINFSRFGLDDIDKKIVLALNDNSRKGYRELSEDVGISEDVVRYRFKKIVDSGIIKRFTMLMQPPPEISVVTYLVNYSFAPETESRAKRMRAIYQGIDGELPLINTFQVLAPTSGAYRFFAIACGEDRKILLKNSVDAQKVIFKEDGSKVIYAWLKKVVKGSLLIRNIDVAKDYQVAIWR